MLKKLGKYEVIEELGKGAMGVVYKAYDPLMARYVALKTMSYSSAADPEFKKRFYKEAQAPGRLHHENIVIIYELNEDEGVPYIAMEFLDGSDLHGMIQSDYIFTLKKIIDIMVQVCEGLHFAHQNGIIHRDVKPANVFLLKNGKVKIVDFGIAQISQSSLMTRTGMILGTPSYMSPEQVRCDTITGTSDQFGVGVILYELLTGRRPFEGDTYSTILYKILHEEPVPLREHYPTCPPELDSLVMKVLGKNPSDRFTDLGSVARRLRKIEAEIDQDMAMESTLCITRAPAGDQSLKIELVHRYMREGKFDLALRVLEKMKSLGEKPEILEALQEDIQEKRRLARIEELVGEGSNFFDDEHFDLALECFNEALALETENPRVLEWIRKTHQKESEKRLRQSIQQYLDKGNRALEQNNHAEALKIFGEALKLNPAAAEIAEKIKAAQRLLDHSQQETRCRTLVQEARTLLDAGRRQEAHELCRKARELLPDSAEAGRLIREIESQEREETVQHTLQQMEALYLKKRYDEVLTLAAETLPRTGMDSRVQVYVRKSQWAQKRVLTILGAVLLACLGIVVFYLATRPAPPRPAPLPVPGVLLLDLRPAATVVMVAEARTGKTVPLSDRATPLRLELPPGEYEISYRGDPFPAAPVTERVRVESGRTATVSRKLPGFSPAEAIREILSPGGRP